MKKCDCEKVLNRIQDMIKEAQDAYEESCVNYRNVIEENKKSPTRSPEVKQQKEFESACQVNVQWGSLNALRWEYQELKILFGYEKNLD